MATIWLDRRERGSLMLLKFMIWLVRCCGRTLTAPLLYPIAGYFVLTSGEARLASKDFLARAYSRPPGWWEVFLHIHCFATTLLDRVLFFSTSGQDFDVAVNDPDDLVGRMERGEGCVLIGAHLGSFDMLRAFTLKRTKVKFKILMRAEHSQMMTSMLTMLDPKIAETLVTIRGVGDVLRLREWIDQGYIIALLGDRAVEKEQQISVEFLGDKALFPATPIQLASALNAPVYTFFSLYRGGRRYDAHFDLLAERIELPRRGRSEATAKWLKLYADRLAIYARQAPYNWFNFFLFWRA
ncbi:MAG: lipid A biosynthesis acyltransferase [Geminicoccales bacterium]